MDVIKVDPTKRIRLKSLKPGDLYEPEFRSAEEIVLRKVTPPPRTLKMTREQALKAIEKSRLQFTVSWDKLREETRG